jgi:hypothetical protein
MVDDGCPPEPGGQQLVAVSGHGTDRRPACHDQVWSFRRMPPPERIAPVYGQI